MHQFCSTPVAIIKDNVYTLATEPDVIDYTTLSKRMQRNIEFAVNEAITNDGHSRAKICAVVVHKNRIISVGYNSKKTHPFQARFAKNEHAIFIHAEIDAIRKASNVLNNNEMKKATLIVVRVRKNGKWGNARPCIGYNGQGCQSAITCFGIKNVIYSTDIHEHISYLQELI